MLFAIDTNLLVYAHNEDSDFHHQAVRFIEQVFNEYDRPRKKSVNSSLRLM